MVVASCTNPQMSDIKLMLSIAKPCRHGEILALIISSLALLSCASADVVGVDEHGRFPATLEHYGDPVRLNVPTTAEVGQDVSLVVSTYGGGCISPGETEVELDGLKATVRPYDYVPLETLRGDIVCTLDLRLNRHEAILRFDERGVARIDVHGRSLPGRDAVTVVRSILIR